MEGETMQFDAFYQVIGYKSAGECLITPENYSVHPIFVVDLTADRNANKHHLNISRSGEVKLDLEFPGPLGDGKIIVVYAYYNRLIEINHERKLKIV